MVLEDHIDIHQPKEQEKNFAIISTTVMNKKKQQLGKDVIIQSKAPGNYTLMLHNLLLNVLFLFVVVPTFLHLS